MLRTFAFTFAVALALLHPALAANAPQPIEIWPGDVPDEKGDIGPERLMPAQPGQREVERLTDVSRPTITVYRPDAAKANGVAVLICPGGGYHILAMDLEGTEVADWLTSTGVTGIVLKYRVPRRKDQPPHQAPLQDAQRAMSIVRARAAEWGIDPARIGILGFSAGGHLAAATATNSDRRQYEPIDETDKVSCRPDFAVLIYSGYLAEGESLTPEIRIDAKSPPMFLVHADDDRLTSENSVRPYLALKKAGVPAELHVFATGGHGFGLRPSEHSSSGWPTLCEAWMRGRGLLTPKPD